MTDVVDELRKKAWRRARAAERRWRARGRRGQGGQGQQVRAAQEPEDLTEAQGESLERVAREDKPLHRAYLLRKRLRDVFKAGSGAEARLRLESWLASACVTHQDRRGQGAPRRCGA